MQRRVWLDPVSDLPCVSRTASRRRRWRALRWPAAAPISAWRTRGPAGLTPYAAGQFTYASKSVTDIRSELGLRSDKSWAMTDSIFTLRGRFAWAHDYNPDRSIAATFQTLPGAVVNGEGEFSEVTNTYAGKGRGSLHLVNLAVAERPANLQGTRPIPGIASFNQLGKMAARSRTADRRCAGCRIRGSTA
jgi:hypothetical protein